MAEMTRRNFLRTGTAGAAMIAGTMASGSVWGANERIGVVVCGVNGRGGSHIGGFTDSPYSEVVALCDVDKNILDKEAAMVKTASGKKVKKVVDVRDILDSNSIDVVSIATPNHWHSLMAIWAVQAGKDVYVEKPLSHNIYEGRQLANLVAKSDRIVQHGTQGRSSARWLRDMPLLHDGSVIGPIHTGRALGYKNGNRGSLGFPADGEPPKGLDWTLWQGPASDKPFNPAYHPYSWHWFWHYGNGEIGNQGVHQMDIGAWGMNKGLPVKVYSAGGRYTYKDLGETPNTNTAIFTYADGTQLEFAVRNRFTNDEAGVKVGNLFYGEKGYYVEDKGFFDEKDQPIEVKAETPKTEGNYGNFIAAVRSRDKSLIRGTAEEGHLSCVHCHLANVSYRLGRALHFDPASERFVNDDEANAMLSREYRPGFEVPAIA